jgi:hypothetical protein
VRSIARMATVMLLAAACGPAIIPDRDTEGRETTSTGAHESSTTVSPGSLDGTTAIVPGDTTADDESTSTPIDPSGPCPPPIRGLTYLWCGDVSDRTEAITDGTWVYFGTLDGGLWRVPAAGGDAESLAQGLGDLFDLAIVENTIYWTAFFDGVVGSVAVDGGSLRIIAEDLFKPSSVAVAGSYVFVTQYDDDLPVMRYDLDRRTATPLYLDQDHAGHAFVLDDALYFATGTDNGNTPTPLLRGSFDGAPLELVMDAEGSFADIQVEGQTLWWARYHVDGSAILRTDVGTRVATTTTLHALPEHPLRLALAPDRIYWADFIILEYDDDGTDHVVQGRLGSMSREGGEPLVHFMHDSRIAHAMTTEAGVAFLIEGAVARLD